MEEIELRTKINYAIKVVEKKNQIRHKIMSSYLKKGKTLDIGFGVAPNKYLKDAVGVDIGFAPKPKNYVKVIQGSINNLPFEENTFDNILAGEILEHIENPSNAIRECYRILKNNGMFIVSVPNPTGLSGWLRNIGLEKKSILTDHVAELPAHIFRFILENNGFEIVDVRGQYFGIPLLSRFYRRAEYIFTRSTFLSGGIIFACKKIEIKNKREEYLANAYKNRVIRNNNLKK